MEVFSKRTFIGFFFSLKHYKANFTEISTIQSLLNNSYFGLLHTMKYQVLLSVLDAYELINY